MGKCYGSKFVLGFLYRLKRAIAAMTVTVRPITSGSTSVNVLSPVTRMCANCANVGYSEARAIIRSESFICLCAPSSQLLIRVPANSVPSPIHIMGNAPEINIIAPLVKKSR